MRGKVYAAVSMPDTVGITPAYAGKRKKATQCIGMKQDHPRLCGEKIEERNPSDYVLGSPPPMRGKAKDCRPPAEIIRITPAYAGKSGIIPVEVSYM